MSEVWRKVSYADVLPVYEVSNRGNVRRVDDPNCEYWQLAEYYVNVKQDKRCCVVLDTTSGKFKSVEVAKLVALAFVDNLSYNFEVSHKDGNEFNNVPSNLVVSVSDKPVVNGSKRVVELNSWRQFDSISAAAKELGISTRSIGRMVHGERDEVSGYRVRFV